MFNEHKEYLSEHRNDALKLLKQLEPILDKEDLDGYKAQMEENFRKYMNLAQQKFNEKQNEIMAGRGKAR